jgi:hypothetical protein
MKNKIKLQMFWQFFAFVGSKREERFTNIKN